MFNIIDSLVIGDIVQDSMSSLALSKKRAEIDKIYGRIVFEDSSNDEDYEPDSPENATPLIYNDGLDEAGIPGMPPMR